MSRSPKKCIAQLCPRRGNGKPLCEFHYGVLPVEHRSALETYDGKIAAVEWIAKWEHERRVAAMGGVACSCGHQKTAHDHYRPGSECSECDCQGFTTGTVESTP